MYRYLFQIIPAATPWKVAIFVVAALAYVALMFFVVFPWIAPFLPSLP